MTNGVLKSIKHRDQLFRDQLGKSIENLSEAYRRYRDKVLKLVEKAQDMDMFNSFKFIIDNPKKVWSKINFKILNKNESKNALPSEITVGQDKISDKNVIVNNYSQRPPNLHLSETK